MNRDKTFKYCIFLLVIFYRYEYDVYFNCRYAALYRSCLRCSLISHIFKREVHPVTGCAVIALSGDISSGKWIVPGFIIGLCLGSRYALYSIFGKVALRNYHSMTVTLYTFFTCSVCLLPFFRFWKKAALLRLEGWLYMIGLGLFPTVFAYLLYTYWLNKVETSTASILAAVEPVAAAIDWHYPFMNSFKEDNWQGPL